MTVPFASVILDKHLDHSAIGDVTRPALRVVFHRGPDGLTMKWVVERERRNGEVQIIVGDLIPSTTIPDTLQEPGSYRPAADYSESQSG